MNASDLLLTEEERHAAGEEGARSGRADWMEASEEAICRAQVAKVLATLLQEARSDIYDEWHFVNAIITKTGLTWPLKEATP